MYDFVFLIKDEKDLKELKDLISSLSGKVSSEKEFGKKRLAYPIKKQKEAAIINVISKSGVTAQEGQTIYSASKWGMAGFTEVLKTDLHGSHVRVASVYQSGTRTDMFMKTGEKFSAEKLEKFTDPADLADVIVFMLSRPPKIWLHDVRVEQ